MINGTAKEVLEHAKANHGYISVFDFKPLYPLGDYMIGGKTPLSDLLEVARMLLIDINLPLSDVDNLLRECKR